MLNRNHRGASRAAATSKMDIAAALDPPLESYDKMMFIFQENVTL